MNFVRPYDISDNPVFLQKHCRGISDYEQPHSLRGDYSKY